MSRSSSLEAFHNFTINSYYFTSSIVIVGISIGALYSLGPSSLMFSNRRGKNVVSNSLAYSIWLVMGILSALMSYDTLLNTTLLLDFRYLAAFHILSLSARNLFQYFFFYY